MSRKTSGLLTLLLLVILLTSCADAKSASAADNLTDSSDSAGSVKSSLNIGINAEPKSLDPANTKDTITHTVLFQVVDALITETPDDYCTLKPGLAESWEFSADNKSLTFQIRQGVKFHNGDTMNVDDVVFSLNRSLTSSFTSGINGAMEKFEKVDDTHVKLVLKYPYAPILNCMTNASFGIVSKRAVEDAEKAGKDFGRNPVGTGAYKLTEWKNGEKIVLTRHDDYYRGKADIKELTYTIITDPTRGTLALEKGEVDMYYGNQSSDREKLKANKELQFKEGADVGYYHISFNMQSKYFSNKKVRQAVAYAINREDIITGGFDGYAIPVTCPIPPSVFGYQKEFRPLEYNPEKAKALLTEAGYPTGFIVRMKVNQSTTFTKPAEIVKEQLGKIGIILELQPIEKAIYLTEVCDKCDYDITLYAINATIHDADYVCSRRLHSSLINRGNNFSQFKSTSLDKLLDQARASGESKERYALYGKVSEIVKEEVPLIPLAASNGIIFARVGLKGLYFHPDYRLMVNDFSW